MKVTDIGVNRHTGYSKVLKLAKNRYDFTREF